MNYNSIQQTATYSSAF